jgi:hypothetical protein
VIGLLRDVMSQRQTGLHPHERPGALWKPFLSVFDRFKPFTPVFPVFSKNNFGVGNERDCNETKDI